jgi:WD40 repeat protein
MYRPVDEKDESPSDWANCVAFMPDGKGLVSGGSDCKLRYWDVSSLDSTRFQTRSRITKT